MNRLATLLRRKRETLRLTMRGTAKRAGVDLATYFRAESGKRPDITTALRLCRWLGVSVEYAFGGKGRQNCPACAELRMALERAGGLALEIHKLADSTP